MEGALWWGVVLPGLAGWFKCSSRDEIQSAGCGPRLLNAYAQELVPGIETSAEARKVGVRVGKAAYS